MDTVGRSIHIHHAPWSRRVRTMFMRGSVAYELQIGCWVFQWFYTKPNRAVCGHGRVHLWRDYFTNSRRYLLSAPWGSSGHGPFYI